MNRQGMMGAPHTAKGGERMTTREQKILELKRTIDQNLDDFKEKEAEKKIKSAEAFKKKQSRLLREVNRLEGLEKVRKAKLNDQQNYLLGAAVKNLLQTGQATWAEVKEWLKLDSFLTRDIDRAKFDLPPLAPEKHPDGRAEQGRHDGQTG